MRLTGWAFSGAVLAVAVGGWFLMPKPLPAVPVCHTLGANGAPDYGEFFTIIHKRAGEPDLAARKLVWGGRALRFTWRTWRGPIWPALVVRVEWTGYGTARLLAKTAAGPDGHVGNVVDRPLRWRELSGLRALVDSSDIWTSKEGVCDDGLDGSYWLIEQVDRKGYVRVLRWSPPEGSVRKVGRAMLKLAGWDLSMVT